MALNGRFNGIRIEPASNAGLIREVLKNYSMKSDSRVQGPWSDRNIYSGKDLPTVLWPWQQRVCDEVLGDCADDRTVNYIIDLKGRTGKSKFCKYMEYHHKMIMVPWGKTSDILNYVTKTPHKQAFMFDLSRTKPKDWDRDDISAAIEQIRNGHIVNWKYETGGVMFDPPHVWCFSNQPPNLTSMSRDRWRLWEINDVRELVRIGSRRLKEINRSRERDESPGREEGEERDIIDLSD